MSACKKTSREINLASYAKYVAKFEGIAKSQEKR